MVRSRGLASEGSESVGARLNALARELRWHRRAWLALAVLGAGLAFLGAGGVKPEKPLRATRFVLTDPAGTERGALGVEADGTVALRLRDATGAERLAALVDASGPSVGLFEPDRKGAAKLLVEGGVPRLTLSDRTGSDRLWIALRLGSPAIQFLSPDGVARCGLVTMNDDTGIAIVSGADGKTPGLALYDKDRKIAWRAPWLPLREGACSHRGARLARVRARPRPWPRASLRLPHREPPPSLRVGETIRRCELMGERLKVG